MRGPVSLANNGFRLKPSCGCSIGALRKGLRKLGVADDTLVWFTSDNGGLPGFEPDTTGGLRGYKSSMYEGVFDKPVQHHNMTHNQKGNGYLELAKIDTFHMQQYAYMIQRMREIKESDGSTMLENSLITYGAALGDGATHQYYDLPMIVAGGAQGQIKQGRFIRMKSGTLNSNLWLTLANLMGLEMESFADSHGVLSDLWT